ncbi:hypothetical protein GNI_082910 [Gregarina niphandrodes]|uniref:Uncharacterized protein n=1 Tax=Gregarina niphandrodes TaxID=110365 RepID=A0A023B6D4_GRENI|nr:hypothetical protein GNI_082910 [Gregarina niphandrodes]EZG65538.1 hypothetical protein GNI_082910 [Gregarina niphandrodes]|eukprot:XP_011134076.1 hypothetical protein GNI_082910 [Gregarina niphandrodes]
MSFWIAEEQLDAPRLVICSRDRSFACEKCQEEYGVNVHNLEARFWYTPKVDSCSKRATQRDDEQIDGENLFESFLAFVLEVISDRWGGEIANEVVENTESLASIFIAIPARVGSQNIKRLLQAKVIKKANDSYTKGKTGGLDKRALGITESYETFEIVTDNDFQDIFNMLDVLQTMRKNIIFFYDTVIKPTICYQHNGAFHRHLHNLKKRFIRKVTSSREDAEIDLSKSPTVRSIRYVEEDEDDIPEEVISNLSEGAYGCSFRQWYHRLYGRGFCHVVKQSIISSRLFNKRYLKQELRDLRSSIISSINGAFNDISL